MSAPPPATAGPTPSGAGGASAVRGAAGSTTSRRRFRVGRPVQRCAGRGSAQRESESVNLLAERLASTRRPASSMKSRAGGHVSSCFDRTAEPRACEAEAPARRPLRPFRGPNRDASLCGEARGTPRNPLSVPGVGSSLRSFGLETSLDRRVRAAACGSQAVWTRCGPGGSATTAREGPDDEAGLPRGPGVVRRCSCGGP
jgi:hypothetical protein